MSKDIQQTRWNCRSQVLEVFYLFLSYDDLQYKIEIQAGVATQKDTPNTEAMHIHAHNIHIWSVKHPLTSTVAHTHTHTHTYTLPKKITLDDHKTKV